MSGAWASWTIAALLVLGLGWVADWPLVIGAGLLLAILCGSRWIALARERREAADDDVPRTSNIIPFHRSDDPPSGR